MNNNDTLGFLTEKSVTNRTVPGRIDFLICYYYFSTFIDQEMVEQKQRKTLVLFVDVTRPR